MSYLLPNSPPDSRVLKIAVLGCPNVGKSSLVNALANYKSCAVSRRVNTTRSKQNVVVTEDNTQIIFVDLPGILSNEKWYRFDFEKYYMRDVHSAIFAADLIMVIVDVTHPGQRKELHKEIIRALHFFNDKPSILVLNKVDTVKQSPARLLEWTRRLTEGVVAGKVSHVDKFASRIKYLDKRSVQASLLSHPSTELLAKKHLAERPELHLDENSSWDKPWPEEMEKYYIPDFSVLQNHLDIPADVRMWGIDPPAPTPLLPPSENIHLEQYEVDALLLESPKEEQDGKMNEEYEEQPLVTINTSVEIGSDTIDNEIAEYFRDNPPYLDDEDDSLLSVSKVESSLVEKAIESDPVIQFLRQQIMLGEVTKEQAMERRKLWRLISERVVGHTAWRNFEEVFMVSAATGRGVTELRDYLMVLGRSSPWPYHSTLTTDLDPDDIVTQIIWSKCLDTLPKEVPYKVKVRVDDCERGPDGRLYISASLLCTTSRHMMIVIGAQAENITRIAHESKVQLEQMIDGSVTVKLAAVRATIPKAHLKAIKMSGSFKKIMPDSVY